jgi:2-methylcitrate dehydratase PrpD
MTIAAFEDSAYRDPSIRPLMNKIRVDLDKEVDALYPKTISMKIKATKKDRSVIELWPRDPLGHVNKPMGNDDVKSKFLRTVEPVYGKEKTTRVLERWWDVSKASATEVAESLALLDVKN